MADAKIEHKPTGKVSSLGAPTRGRGNRKMTASWKVPSALTSGKSDKRATHMLARWIFEFSVTKNLGKKLGSVDVLDMATRERTQIISDKNTVVNLASFGAVPTGKKKEKTYKRDDFYPVTKRKLMSVSIAVHAKNDKGEGPAASATRKFSKPRKPTVSALTQNEDTGRVSCTITAGKDDDYHERYWTRYTLTVYDSRQKKDIYVKDDHFTDASLAVSYDVQDRMGLDYGQYVKVTVKAWSQGYAGDSGTASVSTVVGYSALPTITGVRVSSRDSGGKVTVTLNTNAKGTKPVDGVRLQKLQNVSYATADAIPLRDDIWQETTAVDNGECTALALSVGSLAPDPGKHTWVRVKAWNDFEDMFARYSEPYLLKELETPAPTAEDDSIAFLSLTSGVDGQSAVALLGWNKDGTDDSTHTELSWADAQDAWRSTEEPKTHAFQWSDGSVTFNGVTYNDSASVTIKGLEEGGLYFAQARRFMEAEEGTTYGPYSNMLAVMPSTAPTSVALAAPDFIARGSSAQFTWTYDSPSMQRSWKLCLQEGSGQSSDDLIIDEGTDAVGSCRIPWSRLEDLTDDGAIQVYVVMSTGGGEVSSETASCRIADPPEVTVSAPDTLTAQPAAFALSCSIATATVALVVTAQGAGGSWPDGDGVQVAGDTIWSDVIAPVWASDGAGGYTASVAAPEELGFWDLASYEVVAKATDPETGLVSEESSAEFSVEWAHQAPQPSPSISVRPYDETDENGFRTVAAEIALSPPDSAAEDDVYDIYRQSVGGMALVARGAALDAVVTDRFAPFGDAELSYRVACRTADGDVDWADYPYELQGPSFRADWGGKYVELHYTVSVSGSYEKDSEVRTHLDGSSALYSNPGCKRSGSASAVLINAESQEEFALLHELGAHPGPAFVRTADGQAYEADVQLSDIGGAVCSALSSVRINLTAIDLTDDFLADVPVAEADEEEGEG